MGNSKKNEMAGQMNGEQRGRKWPASAPLVPLFIVFIFMLGWGSGEVIWAAGGGEGILAGRVTMAEQGLPGVTVTATGPIGVQAVTTLDGTYQFTGLPGGIYTLTLTQDGFRGSPSSRAVVLSGPAMRGLDFQAIPSPSLLPTVRLTPSATLVHPGDTFVLRLSLTPGSQEPAADLYLFLLPPGTPLHSQAPWQGNLLVPAITDLAVFSHTVTGTEPAGTYTWLAFFTRPGSLDLLGPVASAAVTVQP
jgi:hypothetical protein